MLAVGPPRSEITPVKPGRLVAHPLDLAQHRGLGSVLDDAPLVFGDRAEGAAAEAAAHDRDRGLDHLVGGDLGAARSAGGGGGCRAARRRASISGAGERQRRRVEPDVAIAVRAGPAPGRCRGSIPGAGCARRGRTAPGRSSTASKPGRRMTVRWRGRRASPRRRWTSARRRRLAVAGRARPPGAVLRRRDRRAGRAGRARPPRVESISRQPGGRRRRSRRAKAVPRTSVSAASGSPAARRRAISTTCALAVAEDQQVGLGVEQDRAPDLLRPVVEVGDPPQAGLDAADHDGHVAERLPAALGVDDHRPVGAQPGPRRPANRRRRCGCAGREV